MIRPLDRERLRNDFNSAQPFRFFSVDNFLEEGVAERVYRSYPKFEDALKLGSTFKALNEHRKVQITESPKFPEIVQKLNAELASPQFLSDLSFITGIDDLLADDQLAGGACTLPVQAAGSTFT